MALLGPFGCLGGLFDQLNANNTFPLLLFLNNLNCLPDALAFFIADHASSCVLNEASVVCLPLFMINEYIISVDESDVHVKYRLLFTESILLFGTLPLDLMCSL